MIAGVSWVGVGFGARALALPRFWYSQDILECEWLRVSAHPERVEELIGKMWQLATCFHLGSYGSRRLLSYILRRWLLFCSGGHCRQ